MDNSEPLKILFVINPGSGNKQVNYEDDIRKYLHPYNHLVKYYTMPLSCNKSEIKKEAQAHDAGCVVAVGGDGTLKLVAESCIDLGVNIGIIPAGSANGMAKELGIPLKLDDALEVILNGNTFPISLVEINGEYCIHLSDIGFNAFVVKKFEAQKGRGMWGYIKASWQVLKSHRKMQVSFITNKKTLEREAAMVVIANATRYGSGAVINPIGQLSDDVFEVVIVKKVSFSELFKMFVTKSRYDPQKTEVLQASELTIKSKHRVHFQVDGEYMGKTNEVKASIKPRALQVIVPGVYEKKQSSGLAKREPDSYFSL